MGEYHALEPSWKTRTWARPNAPSRFLSSVKASGTIIRPGYSAIPVQRRSQCRGCV